MLEGILKIITGLIKAVTGILRLIFRPIPFIGNQIADSIHFISDNLISLIYKLHYIIGGALFIAMVFIVLAGFGII